MEVGQTEKHVRKRVSSPHSSSNAHVHSVLPRVLHVVRTHAQHPVYAGRSPVPYAHLRGSLLSSDGRIQRFGHKQRYSPNSDHMKWPLKNSQKDPLFPLHLHYIISSITVCSDARIHCRLNFKILYVAGTSCRAHTSFPIRLFGQISYITSYLHILLLAKDASSRACIPPGTAWRQPGRILQRVVFPSKNWWVKWR